MSCLMFGVLTRGALGVLTRGALTRLAPMRAAEPSSCEDTAPIRRTAFDGGMVGLHWPRFDGAGRAVRDARTRLGPTV